MKLVFCTQCWDVVKLDTDETRSCKCGASSGQYRKDGLHAWVKGPCLALGLSNDHLAQAIRVHGSGYYRPVKIEGTTIPKGHSTHLDHLDD